MMTRYSSSLSLLPRLRAWCSVYLHSLWRRIMSASVDRSEERATTHDPIHTWAQGRCKSKAYARSHQWAQHCHLVTQRQVKPVLLQSHGRLLCITP